MPTLASATLEAEGWEEGVRAVGKQGQHPFSSLPGINAFPKLGERLTE